MSWDMVSTKSWNGTLPWAPCDVARGEQENGSGATPKAARAGPGHPDPKAAAAERPGARRPPERGRGAPAGRGLEVQRSGYWVTHNESSLKTWLEDSVETPEGLRSARR